MVSISFNATFNTCCVNLRSSPVLAFSFPEPFFKFFLLYLRFSFLSPNRLASQHNHCVLRFNHWEFFNFNVEVCCSSKYMAVRLKIEIQSAHLQLANLWNNWPIMIDFYRPRCFRKYKVVFSFSFLNAFCYPLIYFGPDAFQNALRYRLLYKMLSAAFILFARMNAKINTLMFKCFLNFQMIY